MECILRCGSPRWKHIAMKKPNNTGALYHNYKGFFSIVMFALVDGEYKFRRVNAGTAGSCSDAQLLVPLG